MHDDPDPPINLSREKLQKLTYERMVSTIIRLMENAISNGEFFIEYPMPGAHSYELSCIETIINRDFGGAFNFVADGGGKLFLTWYPETPISSPTVIRNPKHHSYFGAMNARSTGIH